MLLESHGADVKAFAIATEDVGTWNYESHLPIAAAVYNRNLFYTSTSGLSAPYTSCAYPPLSSVRQVQADVRLAVISGYHWFWLKPKGTPSQFLASPIPNDPSTAPP